MMLRRSGVPDGDQVRAQFPEEDVLQKPKAIIECYEEIPCNPCSTSCPFDAIAIPGDINVRPRIDFARCTGCGICVYQCPGLAITIMQIKDDKAVLKIPYEFAPLPKAGEWRTVLDRSGRALVKGRILKVVMTQKQDRTALVHVEVPKRYIYDAITIEVSER